jgi:hypothetical protein
VEGLGGFDEVGHGDGGGGLWGVPGFPGEVVTSELLTERHRAEFCLEEVGLWEGDALLFTPEAVPRGKGRHQREHPPAQLDRAPELPRFEAGVGRFELGHGLA